MAGDAGGRAAEGDRDRDLGQRRQREVERIGEHGLVCGMVTTRRRENVSALSVPVLIALPLVDSATWTAFIVTGRRRTRSTGAGAAAIR